MHAAPCRVAHVVPCSGIRSMFLTCVACLSRFIQLRACSASCKVRAACVALFIKQRVPLHVRRVVYSFTHSTAPLARTLSTCANINLI